MARSTLNDPTPVSFDYEPNDRFNYQRNPPIIKKIVDIYKQKGGIAKVGFYGNAPQNTYGSATPATYNQLNQDYAPMATWADILSPVLYNYGQTLSNWTASAQYNISQAKAYNTGKPIYPYISLTTGSIAESAMRTKLQTLFDMGANGAIIWAGSSTNTVANAFNPAAGWGKGVMDFIRSIQ